MSAQSWCQAIITAAVIGSTVSNTTTATSILPAAAKFTLPANQLQMPGNVIRITMVGNVSNTTTNGTLTLDVRHGVTIVFNGGAVAFSTTSHTTLPYWWDVLLTCRAIGSSANYMGQGRIMGQMLLSSGADLATMGLQLTPNTGPAVGSNFDSTAAQVIDVFATWSTALAAASITPQQFMVELCN